jgi:hypothetical protein
MLQLAAMHCDEAQAALAIVVQSMASTVPATVYSWLCRRHCCIVSCEAHANALGCKRNVDHSATSQAASAERCTVVVLRGTVWYAFTSVGLQLMFYLSATACD